MRIEIFVPDALAEELVAAAKNCHTAPAVFASEAVESVLATRRLDQITDPNTITSPRMPEYNETGGK